jgi:hypothetical protein
LLTAAFNLENKFFLSSPLPENWRKNFQIDMAIDPKPPETSRKWQNHFHPSLRLMAKVKRSAISGNLFTLAGMEKPA